MKRVVRQALDRASPFIGKHGLRGNSGFIPGGHISANYDCNGLVFVEWKYRQIHTDSKTWERFAETFDGWKRMTLARARREKRRIIQCAYCAEPAVSLDHLWPYHSEKNWCAVHKGRVPWKQSNARGQTPSEAR